MPRRQQFQPRIMCDEGKTPNFYVNVASNLAELMRNQPSVRLLHLGGYYDLATPLLAARYALTHAGIPLDRMNSYAFVAGHSPFSGEENRKCVSSVVKAFCRTKAIFINRNVFH
ncbi:hypothetical protein [Aliivibrio sp.]|uniref:hypothetical protein n=1 Tax=Aliivibrio sp. TaxID=1872443 RepID=UPI003D2F025F